MSLSSTKIKEEAKSSLSLKNNKRDVLCELPHGVLKELPGQPNIVYELRKYDAKKNGASIARKELPFLFKPFEMGQIPPPSQPSIPSLKSTKVSSSSNGNKKSKKKNYSQKNYECQKKQKNESTIHEFLDWTVTAVKPEVDESEKDEIIVQDFRGFRIIVLFERERFKWPSPDVYLEGEKIEEEFLGTTTTTNMAPPLPYLVTKGKPVSCATIRSGDEFLEISFFATRENRRGKGYGKALLEAIEDVGRCCQCKRLLLCSTDDPNTINTWKHLGFEETSEEQLNEWNINEFDIVHMTNTVQLHKEIQEKKKFKSLVLKHKGYQQRMYFEVKDNYN